MKKFFLTVFCKEANKLPWIILYRFPKPNYSQVLLLLHAVRWNLPAARIVSVGSTPYQLILPCYQLILPCYQLIIPYYQLIFPCYQLICSLLILPCY
jgi:hypothetical protein